MRTRAYGPRIVLKMVEDLEPDIQGELEGEYDDSITLGDVWMIGISREIVRWLNPFDVIQLNRTSSVFSSTRRSEGQAYTPIKEKSWVSVSTFFVGNYATSWHGIHGARICT